MIENKVDADNKAAVQKEEGETAGQEEEGVHEAHVQVKEEHI